MAIPGFVSGAYKLATVNVSGDRLVNMFTERIEQGPRQGQLYLRQIPGLKDFLTLPTQPLRALWSDQSANRLFAVSGSKLYEVFENAPPNLIGDVGIGTNPAIIASNGFQLAIASGGRLYLAPGGNKVIPVTFEQGIGVVDTNGTAVTWDSGDQFVPHMVGNVILINGTEYTVAAFVDAEHITLNVPAGVQAGVQYVAFDSNNPVTAGSVTFLDNYFIVALANSKQVFISNLAPDGEIWDPGDVAQKEGYADNIARVFADNEQLWLFGFETTEVWVNTGALFPFERIQGAVLKIGCSAPFSVAGIQGYRFWLWNGVVYMAYGLNPQRVSDFGVEQAISKYANPQNAEGWCYLDGGHVFYVLSFDEGTWVYDASLKIWHERLFFSNGEYSRYRGRVYARVWNRDFVGDYESGKIFELDVATKTDAGGSPLRRQRICPYVQNHMSNVRYNRLTVDMDTGVGLDVQSGQPGYDPQIIMRYSTNRGKTWSYDLQRSLGKVGEVNKRVFWPQLGSSRIGHDFDLVVTDPIDVAINNAYLDLNPLNARP